MRAQNSCEEVHVDVFHDGSSIAEWRNRQDEADVTQTLFGDMIQLTIAGDDMRDGAETQKDTEDNEGEASVDRDGLTSSKRR